MSSNALAYLEDYLDTFEALPIEVTKQMTLLKELGTFRNTQSKSLTFSFSHSLDARCKSYNLLYESFTIRLNILEALDPMHPSTMPCTHQLVSKQDNIIT